MALAKICQRCGARLKVGETCPCMVARQEERKKAYMRRYDKSKRDRKADAFYHSAGWQKARLMALHKYHSLDVYELAHGKIVAADTVHHIRPLREDWDRRFDMENLIPLSNKTHEHIHELYDEGKKEETQEMLYRCLEAAAGLVCGTQGG